MNDREYRSASAPRRRSVEETQVRSRRTAGGSERDRRASAEGARSRAAYSDAARSRAASSDTVRSRAASSDTARSRAASADAVRSRTASADAAGNRTASARTGRRPVRRSRSVSHHAGSPIIFTVLKVICLAALVFFLYTKMSGSRLSTVTFADMQSAVTGAADMATMQEADNQMIKRLYGLDPSLYDGVCLYYPLTNMGAEELFLLKLKDISQQDEVRSAIEGRLATQKKSFEGYGIEQSAMLNRSVYEVRGNYAIFVSADDTAPMKNAFDRTY